MYHGKIIGTGISKNILKDTTLIESIEEAKSFTALKQLRQLRKCYVGDWEPDWMSETQSKYCIDLKANYFDIECWYHMNSPLSFPTSKLAEQFLTNFKDLLEIAKPLL